MSTSSRPARVVLRGGVVVSVGSLQTLWRLETIGCRVKVADDGRLVVAPRSALSDTERVEIKRYRDELLRLVSYVDKVIT